jgi:hypothetical protein
LLIEIVLEKDLFFQMFLDVDILYNFGPEMMIRPDPLEEENFSYCY